MSTPTLPPSEPLTRPVAHRLCLFRDCSWRITGDAPETVVEEMCARHLLAAHRDALVVLGRPAEHGELL